MKVYTVHEVLESTQKKLAEVKAERDALAAQVSRMPTFIKLSAAKWENCHEVYPTFWNLLRVANETPQQHLAEIRAEAGRDGYIAACLSWMGLKNAEGMVFSDADKYADSIRQEVK